MGAVRHLMALLPCFFIGVNLMELIEKAIEKCDTPYTSIAAPYFLARALQYDKMQNYRKAMLDFYRYEILMNGNVGHEFYFYRGESEMRGKLYQQALNDLAHAVALDPKNTMYWAELASANLKVKKFNEAIISSQEWEAQAEFFWDLSLQQ